MAKIAILLTIILLAMGADEVRGAPIAGPVVSAAATSVVNWAGGLSGVREFITGIRAAFGVAGDFSKNMGFDYSHIYNSLLQYNVVQAYETASIGRITSHIADQLDRALAEGDKIFWGILGLVGIMLVNIAIAMRGGRQTQDQNVNVLNNH